MDAARRELVEVLREARALLALPTNDFSWSSWKDAAAAVEELEQRIATVEAGGLPGRVELAVLFAPTGPIQEVSLSRGWAHEFLGVANRFDAAAERVYAELGAAADRAGQELIRGSRYFSRHGG